ncbi:MAG: lipopolysaccharide kinase InaA family protein [Azoarcus sp.]|jgi:tRNA A-37 threonylcarbamoyl transferase component Bud32|nr:lipopolysaccharide kinase InaA family protein [Azoarcus sp.]
MEDFIFSDDRVLLERHGLASFEALWDLRLPGIDAPNLDRGGWSEVSRLALEGRAYYLKRQRNHLTRSITRPYGEPTFVREFRAIKRLRTLGVPALDVVFFACRRLPGKTPRKVDECAILLTRALDGWRAMDRWLAQWETLSGATRAGLLAACGKTARQLHASGLTHGCFYPKHVFLREADGGFEATLIDLEKVRPAYLGRRDRQRDLDQFFRHASALGESEADALLAAYLACAPENAEVADWRKRLSKRRAKKENG